MHCITTSKKELNLITKGSKRGGEGCIYRVAGRSKLVAKVYHDGKATEEKRHKLEAMLANPPKRLTRAHCLAWPQDILLNEVGQFIGFTMLAAKEGSDVLAAYTHRERRNNNHPNTTRRNLYKMAINLCYALDAVHAQGHVIGDFNPNNIMCRENGDVTLIDTDSFCIQEKALFNVYPCEVGMDDYIAPEIQKKNRSKITWKKEHDHFALAVHLFQILLNNRHPFAATPAIGTAPAEYAVKLLVKGIYPHVRNPETQPDDITDILPQKMQQAFRQTFVDGFRNPAHRYTSKQWIALLKQELKSLKQCHACPEQYEAHAPHCPYCGAEPADHTFRLGEFFAEPLNRLKLDPAMVARPFMLALTCLRSRLSQDTVLPKAPVSLRKRIVISLGATAAIAIVSGIILKNFSEPKGYTPTPSTVKRPSSLPQAEKIRPTRLTPEQEFVGLLRLMSRYRIVPVKQGTMRTAPDGRRRFEYQSQNYQYQHGAFAEYERIKAQIERFLLTRANFKEVPIEGLHQHFTTGCHFRAGSCSMLLVIERYTDKHRVVLIAQ